MILRRYIYMYMKYCTATYKYLDHSCNKYCNLIGQEEVTNSDRHLHDSDRYLRVLDTYNFMNRVLVNLYRVPVSFY